MGVLLILSFAALAQDIGCCCDPVLRNGSFSSKQQCDAQGFFFAGPPPSLFVTCGQHCNATLLGSGAACGNSVCELSETSVSCPADCLPQVGACGSPTYKTAPSNFILPFHESVDL